MTYLKSLAILILSGSLAACSQNQNASRTQADTFYTLEDFDKVEKFDTHAHISVYDTTFIKQAEKDNMRLLTVNVNSGRTTVDEQQKVAVALIKKYPDRLAYLTSFELGGFNDADWQAKTLAYLNDSFAKGAIGVKIWKNLGMELKGQDGKFVMIDDQRFDPIIEFIEKNDLTLLGHLGEPKNAWLPVEKMTVMGDKTYFAEHPQYHMFLHPEYPSYDEQVAARDRMLDKHPNLRFVAAHLGSVEWSVDEIAHRLDKYPNIAMDMAERICHLQYQSVQDWQKVRNFFIKYQDRLVYSTDNGVSAQSNLAEVNKDFHNIRLSDWKFFVTDDTMSTRHFKEPFKGLHLPKAVVDKLYRTNAERWFPGIKKS